MALEECRVVYNCHDQFSEEELLEYDSTIEFSD